jgi:hypothetical protein
MKSFILGGFAGLVVVLAGWLTGCSSPPDESGKTGGSAQTQTKSPTTPAPDKTAEDISTSGDTECVAPGTKGNEKGVGAYCQAATECSQGTFCTAGVAPKGAEFCTAFCSTDADCGAGATCYTDPRGRACVPAACVALQSK